MLLPRWLGPAQPLVPPVHGRTPHEPLVASVLEAGNATPGYPGPGGE